MRISDQPVREEAGNETETNLVRKCEFSTNRAYRYTLWRQWGTSDLLELFTLPKPQDSTVPYAMFVGLNPSTADETDDDPTIRRCIDFANRWGFTALCMTNLFAFRATDPLVMKEATDPIGRENDYWLRRVAHEAGVIIAAWGKHGSYMDRAAKVLAMLPGVYYLRLNADGSPEHPLYIPAVTAPTPFRKS